MRTGISSAIQRIFALSRGLSRHRHNGPALLLILLSIFVCVYRLRTFYEPLDRDLTGYAVVGHEILAGRILYAESWDHKPPAIHFTYALAELLAGYGYGQLYLLGVLSTLLTLVAVYQAGRMLSNSIAGGICAAVFWTLVASDLVLQANMPNVEVFINAACTWALVLLLRIHDGAGSRWSVVGIGLLMALATLYKHVAIGPLGALLTLHVGLNWTEGTSRRQALWHAGIILGIVAAAWGLVSLYFLAVGHHSDYVDAVFRFNRYYASITNSVSKPSAVRWIEIVYKRFLDGWCAPVFGQIEHLLILPILACAGLVVGFDRGPRRPWLILLAWYAGAVAAVTLPGFLHRHYLQLLLPSLSIAGGLALVTFAHSPTPAIARRGLGSLWTPRNFSIAVGCLAMVVLARPAIVSGKLSAEQWSQKKYGSLFVESQKVGKSLGKLLKPDETFFEFGDETGLWFDAGRRPPTSVFYIRPAVDGPLVGKLTERTLDELQRSPPEMAIIGAASLRHSPQHAVLKWISDHYAELPSLEQHTNFVLMVRRGGRLATESATNRLPGEIR